MTSWINFAVLVVMVALTHVFYIKSVGPARLAERIGPAAYKRCGMYRWICGIFMFGAMASYVVFYFYPLPVSFIPARFDWPWWISAAIAAALALPAGYIWVRGMIDAGAETMSPREEHTMYGGIYHRIRHPQAVGETPFWLVFALCLHSPSLTVFSLLWFPLVFAWCRAEERDLLLRYGESYREYLERTPAFFPKLRRTGV